MRRLVFSLILLTLGATPAAACVGKTLVIGALDSPRGQVMAQLLAILINERTGTTIRVERHPDAETLHRKLALGELDIAVEHTDRALARLGMTASPADPAASFARVKAAYLEQLNLVWLPLLGCGAAEPGAGPAAPVARKDTLKKFPALPRLIAKTEGVLPDASLEALAAAPQPAVATRAFLRDKKLI